MLATHRYWKLWFWEHRGELWKDCLIGFAVALAQVPEAIAFAFVAGMPPIVGLYGTNVVLILCPTNYCVLITMGPCRTS